MITRLFLLVTLSFGLAVGARAADAGQGPISVRDAWARASATSNSAAYFTVENLGEADRLTAVSTPRAEKAELHTTIEEGNVMKMRPVDRLDIPAQGSVTLKPQGLHVMLIGLKGPLKAGETLPLTVHFEKAGDIQVSVAVVKVGARAAGEASADHDHMMMDHDHMMMDHDHMMGQQPDRKSVV